MQCDKRIMSEFGGDKTGSTEGNLASPLKKDTDIM